MGARERVTRLRLGLRVRVALALLEAALDLLRERLAVGQVMVVGHVLLRVSVRVRVS